MTRERSGEPKHPTQRPPVVPRPAATVMLVRDRVDGPEVFLMKRSGFGSFGGLHVFPGGKVDGTDEVGHWSRFVQDLEDAEASRTLGVESGGLAYWVACIRECFEEAGILLATDLEGRALPLSDAPRRARFERWRDALNRSEEGTLEAMCEHEGLRLATAELAYVSHWITPVSEPARFDTRFFVARAPAGQEALHDGHETVDSDWMRPEIALERFSSGELNLISPTQKNLETIAGYASTDALLRALNAVDPRSIPTILPRIERRAEGGYDEVLETLDTRDPAPGATPE